MACVTWLMSGSPVATPGPLPAAKPGQMMSVQPRKPMVAPLLARTMAGRRAALAFLPAPTTLMPAASTRADGVEQAGLPLVDGVVVGHVHDVDAGVGQAGGQPWVALKVHVFAGVGVADRGERRLEVDPGGVGRPQDRRDAGEDRVGAVRRDVRLDAPVAHRVAARDDRHAGARRRRLGPTPRGLERRASARSSTRARRRSKRRGRGRRSRPRPRARTPSPARRPPRR